MLLNDPSTQMFHIGKLHYYALAQLNKRQIAREAGNYFDYIDGILQERDNRESAKAFEDK